MNLLIQFCRKLVSSKTKFLPICVFRTIISGSDDHFQFKTCLMSNVSSCSPSRSHKFTVAVYNPLSRVVSSPIDIPISSQAWTIVDLDGKYLIKKKNLKSMCLLGNEVEYQVEPTIIDFSYVNNVPTTPYTCSFIARDLPPLGYKIFTFTQADKKSTNLSFGNTNTTFEIDEDSGLIKSITMNGVTLDVTQDLYYYKSGSYSGAYIFVPLVNQKFRVAEGKVKTTPIVGNVYQAVEQEFAPWAKQIVKVYSGESSYIEIEWIVGPIDLVS